MVHHFGGNDGLRAEVDRHVAAIFDELFAAFGRDPALLAAFLVANDLRRAAAAPHLSEVLDVDPLRSEDPGLTGAGQFACCGRMRGCSGPARCGSWPSGRGLTAASSVSSLRTT